VGFDADEFDGVIFAYVLDEIGGVNGLPVAVVLTERSECKGTADVFAVEVNDVACVVNGEA